MKTVCQNKKAFHDYHIVDRIEAGIVLTGDEVKSLRAGHGSLVGAFAHMYKGELFLVNAHITPYDKAFEKRLDDDHARRRRKLLLHKRELNRLLGEMARQGVAVVPLKIYFNDKNKAKVELGIAKGKKKADKRQALKERDIKRETERALKNY